MCVTISFGIQKGGVGKTTACAITSYLLARDGAKVLVVDFDSQGNLTEFLTRQDIYDFQHYTALEAVKDQNPIRYIHHISENLHLLPAEDLLATFSRWLYREYKGDPTQVLAKTLEVVKNDYDYILIDLPPNLGDQTINGLTASDYAVVILQSEPFCYSALERYLETIEIVQKTPNPNIRLAGILCALNDSRTSIDSSILIKVREEYQDFVFNSVIKRRSRIKEFVVEGIKDHTKMDQTVLEPYINFVEELKERVKQS
ncbi:ParA family protein [Paenibacillus larvae]|uniref:Sporulation initiation inhibitor protein Soj n=1 Tax=Paenibacillus larvae subsp. larvae TaxID=147375 RepID=A0A2L1U7L2_9BACL|nr:ParA family protein [Paenibacillus larvae]AVF28905.1 sporulation initiation inhibitor protein Soj [Paenibacillus larvae subsp. larvae]MCY9502627.1 ParA family protein [Paenibacillus larvae]MDR5608798.1 ParA family protein [Paenibacillus larvae]